MSTARLIELTDTVVALDAQLNNGRTGATVIVAVREADTTDSWLDFNDNTFKTAGWTTRQAAMTEISAANVPGLYRTAIDITALSPARVAGDRLVVEFDASAVGPPLQVHGIDQLSLVETIYDVASAAAITALNNLSIADVQTALTNQGYTGARAILLDNLDALISSRAVAGDAMALTAAAIDAIWDEVQAGHVVAGSFGAFLNALITSRSSHSAADVDTTLTAAHGAGNWTTATSVGLTAAAIDAIWDELLAGHVIVGSTGAALAAAGAGGDPAAIADAVWDELQSGHLTAGTFGAFLNATISLLQTEIAAAARAATNQAEHDATQATLAGLNDIDIADVQTALTNQGYTAARAPNLDNLDAQVSLVETEASAAARAVTNQAEHDATQALIAGLNDPDVAAIVAGILAGIIDGTVDLGEVLLRVNAFVRGRILRDTINTTTDDIEYFEEDGTTIAFENRKTPANRTPQ